VTEPLVLLTLDEPALAAAGLRVVREPGDPSDSDSERFPHVYGGPLPVAAVSRVEPLVRPENDLGRPSGAAPVMPGPQQATPESTAPFDPWWANADRTEY
jgi:hypothetical protein